MKKLRNAVRLLSLLLLFAFIGLGGWFAYTVYTQGSRWSTNPYNSRLNAAKKTVGMGEITDRNGLVLASTDAEGFRHYNENDAIRRALSQTVGDQLSMSGTGVETFHAGTLLSISGSIIDRTFQYVTGQNYQGDHIRLTVDAQLTSYLSKIFPENREGAIVVLNYQTGEIINYKFANGTVPGAGVKIFSSSAGVLGLTAADGSVLVGWTIESSATDGARLFVNVMAAAVALDVP